MDVRKDTVPLERETVVSAFEVLQRYCSYGTETGQICAKGEKSKVPRLSVPQARSRVSQRSGLASKQKNKHGKLTSKLSRHQIPQSILAGLCAADQFRLTNHESL